MPITLAKSKLKSKMLEYFRQIEDSGETIIVTNNGTPVLEIKPIKRRIPVSEAFADVRGKVQYHEDVMMPTTDEWGDLI